MPHELPSQPPLDEVAGESVDDTSDTPKRPRFEQRFGESVEAFQHRRLRVLLHELAEKMVPDPVASVWPKIKAELDEQTRIKNSKHPRIGMLIYSAKKRFRRNH